MIKLLTLGLLSVSPMLVNNEESISQESISITQEESTSQESDTQKLIDKVNDLINKTKELGNTNLVFGFTIGSVISFVVSGSASLALILHRKRINDKILENINTTNGCLGKLNEKVESYSDLFIEKVKEVETFSQDLVYKVNDCSKQLDNAISVLGNYANFNANQKIIITILGELANSSEYVRTGAKEKIEDIVRKVI